MVDREGIEVGVRSVWERMEKSAAASGRGVGDVRLLGVSKTRTVEELLIALDTGLLLGLGENRVQEGEGKIKTWPSDHPVSWHLIGHLQSNKARKAIGLFDMIHSLDGPDLAATLNRLALEIEKSPYPVLIEVNTSGEPSKHGVAPEEAMGLALFVLEACPSLELRGFMTVGPLCDDECRIRKAFESLRLLRDVVSSETGLPLRELSMGMSGDFELAIKEGSTIVRVGSAIFGSREGR